MAIILGSGASQFFPCPYCKCPVCEDARAKGIVKTRTDFLIDEKNVIDFGPDINYQFIKNGLRMDELENIFLTHSHEDHIDTTELGVIGNRKHTLEKPVHVKLWGTEAALNVVREVAAASVGNKDGGYFYKHIELCPIKEFETFETGGLKVTTLLSSHRGSGTDEWGLNYIIEKEGKTLLYANDTGWYPDSTWNFLEKRDFKFDYVIMENTYTGDARNIVKPYSNGHLNTANFLDMLQKLIELGCIDKATPVFATHLSDAGRQLYGDYVKEIESNPNYNITVACDGDKIDF